MPKTRPIKVLMVTRDFPPYLVGGMGVFVKQMSELLPKMGIKLIIIAPLKNTKKRYEKRSDNLEIYRVPTYGKTFLTKVPSLAYFAGKLAQKLDYDLVHLLTPCFTQFNCPVITNFHSTRYGEYRGLIKGKSYLTGWLNAIYIPSEKKMVKRADLVLALTAEMKREILKFCVVDEQKIQILPNGVDLTIFKLSKKRQKNKIKKILYVGRLDLRKRVSDLIKAFDKSRKEVKSELIIAGDGPLKKDLKKLSRGLPIKFLGKVAHEKMPSLYRESDLIVLPSSYEAFPLTILEAMASGVPMLTSDSCPDLGNPQFETSNINNLEKMMVDILVDRNKADKIVHQGLDTVQNLTWENTAKQLFSIYGSLMR